MNKKKTILFLPGDGIGPEVSSSAKSILESINEIYNLNFVIEEALVGGSAYDQTGVPLPEETLNIARKSDAILLGAVGGPKWDDLDYQYRLSLIHI